jgi:hypothetical protein
VNEQEPWRVPDVPSPASDDVPFEVLSAAQSAFAARVPDAAVLRLVFDSLLGERRSALVDGRQLRFSGPPAPAGTKEPPPGIEVTVDSSGTELAVTVVVIPARKVELTVRHGGGTTGAHTDDRGRASISGLAPGPFSVVTHEVDEVDPVQTAWVTL